MDQIPPMNLDPQATPWGRWAQTTITNLIGEVRVLQQNASNASLTSISTASSIQKQILALAALETGLQAQVNALVGANVNTSNVNATNVNTSTLTASGTISSGSDTTVGGLLRNVSAYSNPITSSYRAVWVTSVDGQFGYNLSSGRFKQDVKDAAIDPATILFLRIVTFRYIAAVELEGDLAAIEIGLIAEEVDELGLQWLVEYDDDRKPCGIKFHLLGIALLAVVQDHEARLARLESNFAN